MVTDEMVEKAARRMAVADGQNPDKLSHNSFEWWRHYVPMARAALEAALSAAEPLKTAFEVASKHIPEARVSLLSRAIRQGLNDYGWKNFGTLPEVLMGYIVQAERAEEAAHPQKPRDCGHDGGDLSERRDNIGSAYTRSALSAQVQDVAESENPSHDAYEAWLKRNGYPHTVARALAFEHGWRAHKKIAAAPAKQEGKP